MTTLTVLDQQSDAEVVQGPTVAIPWGGQCIDKAFIEMLSTIFGRSVLNDLKEEEFEDYVDLLLQFELKKRSVRSDQTNTKVINLPVSFIDLIRMKHREVESTIENSPFKDRLRYSKRKLYLESDCFRDLFRETNTRIVAFIQKVLSYPELSDVCTVLLVGGYSECELLQNMINKTLERSVTVFIPESADIGVMEGAVIYGCNPVSFFFFC